MSPVMEMQIQIVPKSKDKSCGTTEYRQLYYCTIENITETTITPIAMINMVATMTSLSNSNSNY